MMRNKLPQALPCLQITSLAAQVAEKYDLRPVPYSALRRVYDTGRAVAEIQVDKIAAFVEQSRAAE